LASLSFLSGPDGAVGDPSNLILRSVQTAVIPKSKVNGNRIVGPLKVWEQGQKVPNGYDNNHKRLIPVQAQTSFNNFLKALPSTGSQLSTANAGGQAPPNLTIWNSGRPRADVKSSARLGYPAPNGYTLALQKAADAVNGRGQQPNGPQSNWQGFFTYPQENIYAQATVPVTSKVELNVYGLSSPLALTGSGSDDTITGTSLKETITGGLGADTLTGGGGSDTFLYLTPASSLPDHENFDIITDFSSANDLIDLYQIATDSKITIKYDGSRFSGAAGSLIFAPGGGVGFLSLDITGDSQADFSIQLKGILTLPTSATWLVA
jgi:Peptidase M10 serralysin C terminal